MKFTGFFVQIFDICDSGSSGVLWWWCCYLLYAIDFVVKMLSVVECAEYESLWLKRLLLSQWLLKIWQSLRFKLNIVRCEYLNEAKKKRADKTTVKHSWILCWLDNHHGGIFVPSVAAPYFALAYLNSNNNSYNKIIIIIANAHARVYQPIHTILCDYYLLIVFLHS